MAFVSLGFAAAPVAPGVRAVPWRRGCSAAAEGDPAESAWIRMDLDAIRIQSATISLTAASVSLFAALELAFLV